MYDLLIIICVHMYVLLIYITGATPHIRIHHRNDPESVLFLLQDGLLLHACKDGMNGWRGSGVVLLPLVSTHIASVTNEEILEALEERGIELHLPTDLHKYQTTDLTYMRDAKGGDFDPKNPPPSAVFYRNFADRTEGGYWGEYEHHEDAGWQEYVLRCWDEEQLSEDHSSSNGGMPSLFDDAPSIRKRRTKGKEEIGGRQEEEEEDEDEDAGDGEEEEELEDDEARAASFAPVHGAN